jgi:hypothetical protein
MDKKHVQSIKEDRLRIDLGIGFNWFDYLGGGGHYARWRRYPLDEPLYPPIEDTAAWDSLFAAMDDLNPGWLRFGIPPNPHVNDDGSPRFDTIHIKRLERVAKWAETRQKPVLLDFFTMPEYYEFERPAGTVDPGDAIINMAAKDNISYARNFAIPFIEHLLNVLKLNAIQYFNPINEPMEYGVYQTPHDDPPAIVHYVDMFCQLRNALDDAGLGSDKIKLVGMDTIEPIRQLLNMHAHGVDIDPYICAYSIHHYNLRLDHRPAKVTPDCGPDYFDVGIAGVVEREDKEIMRYCRLKGKPLWALEMGSFYDGKFSNPAGVANWDTVLTVCEAIIRSSNIGISTFCLWSLLNTNNIDGHWAVIGAKNGEWKGIGYPFSAYRIMSMHLRPGADLVPLSNDANVRPQHLHGSWAFVGQDSASLLLINDDERDPREVTLHYPANWSPPPASTVKRICLDSHSEYPLSEEFLHHKDDKWTVTVPPFSITLFAFSGKAKQ